jgi:outer membrane scaffolding protein for murein synthesis (MipA/OmpV family)
MRTSTSVFWVYQWFACLLLVGIAQGARAQTPSPMQEWQYSGGVILERLFQPETPDWQRVVGAAAELEPAYSGSRAYNVKGGPAVNIFYKDIAFISSGDGLGVNVIRTSHFQAGVALTFDFGRKEEQDYTNLRGMGNIDPAPVVKVFASWALSKKLPLVLRVDARQFVGGAQGLVGDVAIYTPMPGSSRKFVWFVGPSLTLATHHYLQVMYGVTPQQAAATGHPVYEFRQGGTVAAGIGVSATQTLTEHWVINFEGAYSQFRGHPVNSPVIEDRDQKLATLSVDYQW